MDHLWNQSISLVCALQILYMLLFVSYSGGHVTMRMPAVAGFECI